MPTYRKADPDVQMLCATVMERWHQDLFEAGVTCQVLFAHAPRDKNTDEPRGPALRHHGYQAAAIAKINSHEKRVAGETDCQITLDGDRWKDWTEDEQTALMDHECNHFSLCRTKPKKRKRRGQPPTFHGGGDIILDDCHRPKLRMRLHDFELGGFEVIARRHGDSAPEVKNAHQIRDEFGQLLFGFAEDRADRPARNKRMRSAASVS